MLGSPGNWSRIPLDPRSTLWERLVEIFNFSTSVSIFSKRWTMLVKCVISTSFYRGMYQGNRKLAPFLTTRSTNAIEPEYNARKHALTWKERGKTVLVQAMKVHSGNRGRDPLIINRGDRLSGKPHASATLPSSKERPATIEQVAGRTQSRSARFWVKKNLFPCRESNPGVPIPQPSQYLVRFTTTFFIR